MTENITYADQEAVDACKKRLGANPKSLRQLAAEKDWKAFADNFYKLRTAIKNQQLGTLVLINGAEL